ncbi:dCTP deaminase [Candidatus Pacearchaeota archaeon]|nr:dCTP deaminase [Candidatus Pacearchaeota archaeon]
MLSGLAIKEAVQAGTIKIDPFDPERVCSNSYDLTLSRIIKIYSTDSQYLDMKKENPVTQTIMEDDGMLLFPNKLYLACTNEVAGSNVFIPCIDGRSSVARLGIQVHMTAGFGDVGFIGRWTLEIQVVEPVRIYPNVRICQIYFHTLEGEAILYNGKYKDSMAAMSSKMFKDKEFCIEPEPFSMKSIPADPDAILYSIQIDRFCSICGDQQHKMPSGWVCQNGHGGVSETDLTNVSLNCKYTCKCGAKFVAAEDSVRTCWKCVNTRHLGIVDGKSEG